MSVIKRAPKAAAADPASEQAALKAAATAPDSSMKKNVRGKRQMFSVGFELELMAELDAARGKVGLSRPAFLKLALRRLLDDGV